MKRNIWLIGASVGIGKALALELAKEGHNLALSARNEAELVRAHGNLTGDSHLIVPLNVGVYGEVNNAKNNIVDQWGYFDSVIFMAGLYQPMTLDQLDLNQTDNIIKTNLLGAFYVLDAVLPELLSHKKSQISFCASVAGYRGLPRSQPYGASKAGLINLVESLKAEYGHALDVRLINPGFVKSRLTDKNNFHMPMRITVDQAAREIRRGLDAKPYEIHFPRRFTYLMKLLKILPNPLYFKLVGKK